MTKFNWKIILLIVFLVAAIIAIAPWKYFDEGVQISYIPKELSEETGLVKGDIILSINDNQIKNLDDYYSTFNELFEDTSQEVRLTIKTKDKETIFKTKEKPEITVKKLETSNIKAGLDLRGGSRALVKPEKKLTNSEMDTLIGVTQRRLNVYGLTDVKVKKVSDLLGNNYMLVELAGATPEELENLIAKQGKFEAKIKNETVFFGGKKDIVYVCKDDATCAGIRACNKINEEEYACRFEFRIDLSTDAAKKHAEVTGRLEEDPENPGYLDEKLYLYLDDKLVDEDGLFISVDLKGKEATSILISGSGTGVGEAGAFKNAEGEMKRLQTILITGSLPFKLKIEKLDTISPLLGKEFTKNILWTILATILVVAIVVFIRYRKIKLVLSIIGTMLSEIILILGAASAIGWNLDLVSIAGIIAVIGTGVDDQIVIVDSAKSAKFYGWKERIKRAFFIIFGAYATTLFAMLPLWWAGSGLLKGFALTTILGITLGVFITRPAFGVVVSKIIKD